jgi:Exo-beta-D-glucosaminidase Ig-fold domain/Glycosyl hydrolases family 2/F5/8 type C domain/Glycosyl hydrolases family 2, sugar binding domain
MAVAMLASAATIFAQPFTRGVGVYPGNPAEDFAPTLATDQAYRNIALRRPAYHSSAYDYNLTAQLVTDGIKSATLPRWLVTTTSNGVARKNEREYLVDHNTVTTVSLRGAKVWVQFELAGGDGPFEVDRMEVRGSAQSSPQGATGWSAKALGSDDGRTWKELGSASAGQRPGRDFRATIPFAAAAHARFYRVEFEAASALVWRVGEVALYDRDARVEAGGPYHFTSAWMSAGGGEEWVYVDLGAAATFDRIKLFWLRRAATGSIQTSDDEVAWKDLAPLNGESSDDVKLAHAVKARYVRVLMTKPETPGSYILSELEVWGRGGVSAHPKPAQNLSGGGWRVQRDSLVTAAGDALSKPGFDDHEWVVATVPATVLSSYWNAGALPDPNYGDNQLMISDSFFYADFWYRNEFTAPPAAGKRQWLIFDGINWKAEVFLNGEKLGRIEGGFMRGRFDVTGKLHAAGKNALAVKIEKNATPGSVHEKTFDFPGLNGGALGADNPTFHASVGWDWIPTIRGRNAGIWASVHLETAGGVTIEDPFVSTVLPLPDTSSAEVTVEAVLRNATDSAVSGTLRGRFGDTPFEMPVTLEAHAAKSLKAPALDLEHPKLWWPNGYGDPNLYAVHLSFETADHKTTDTKEFQAGVRQFNYSSTAPLKIWINGRRFIARGGNWGFGESMLRYRAREYETAVRYHRDMNFTMIRNWVGQIGDEAFFDACDRNGIVVWQDFWLANPSDGPNPDDNELFLRNARDFVSRIRRHASIGLYCGRNEGNPPDVLEEGIHRVLADLHPDLHYIPSSADVVVSGHGPYKAQSQKSYFEERATPMLHSEMGMPNIVGFDSLRQMMPEAAQWPQGDTWGLHDFTLTGAQGGASFRDMIEKGYGGAKSAEEWVTLAQFVNYNGYRAMFEAQSKNRMGLLIWMSHPCWPSFVWQTYDYYFDPTAAYFGAKKASEPLHIQWNAATDMVEVVNYSGGTGAGLTAHAEILNLDGTRQWEKSVSLESKDDSTAEAIRLEYPASVSAVHFIRLGLIRGAQTISENFYWLAAQEGDYRALRDLPKVKVAAETTMDRHADSWLLTTEVHNTSTAPALMVHVKVVREKSGDRILPALFSDNYISLMPGERRVITIEIQRADARGETPRIEVEGFNVAR